jgi:hypothetical protein
VTRETIVYFSGPVSTRLSGTTVSMRALAAGSYCRVTLGPSMIVQGKSCRIGPSIFNLAGSRQLINQGPGHDANVPTGTLTINPSQFENPGTLRADGASVVIRVTPFTNTGTIQKLNGGKVSINP